MSFLFLGEKGQAEGFDIMAAALVAIILFGFTAGMVGSHSLSADEGTTLYQMQIDAYNLSETIFSDTNCLRGGVVDKKDFISQSKLACFSSQSYDDLRRELGIENYDFRLRVVSNSVTFIDFGTAGQKQSVSMQRIVMLNGSPARALVVLYEK